MARGQTTHYGFQGAAVVMGVEAPGATRQWLSFPPASNALRVPRLRGFRLLIETARGHVVFVAVKGRVPPGHDTIDGIVARLGDGDPYADVLRSHGALDELGLQAQILDGPADSEIEWLSPAILAEILLDETLAWTARGERFSGTERLPFETRLRQELRTAISAFVGKLDAGAVEAARGAEGGIRPASYNYLRGAGDDGRFERRNRIQAATIFPFLLPALATRSRLEPVRQAIDAGRPPLIDMLAQRFGVPKSVVRSLRHQSISCIGPQWNAHPEILAKVLADVPHPLRPRTPDTWRSFNETAALIAKISARPIHTTANRLWMRTAVQQGYKAGETIDDEMEQAARDIDEFCSHLSDALNFRLRAAWGIRGGASVTTAISMLMTAHNPVRLTRIERRWRAAYIREQALFAAERELWMGARWPAVIDDAFESQNRRVVSLTTAVELVEEGTAMDNCVASYAGHCLRGKSPIWSIRDFAGRHRSTLETNISHGASAVHIVQHRGTSNGAPSPECRLAAASLVKHLERRGSDLAAYAHWRKTIASLTRDGKLMAALAKPVIAALDATLPKQWPFERLLSIAGKACDDMLVWCRGT